MFLQSDAPDEGNVLAEYREALLKAFSAETFRRFCHDINISLEQVVATDEALRSVLFEFLLGAAKEGSLRSILIAATRHCAGNKSVVERVGSRLGAQPLVALANGLARLGCTPSLRKLMLNALKPAVRERYRDLYQGLDDKAAWLDTLIWLDDLPGSDSRPALLRVLERLEVEWRPEEPAGADWLREWLDRTCANFDIPREQDERPQADRPPGIVIELNVVGPQCSAVAWLLGAESGRPVQLLERTLPAKPDAEKLCTALSDIVDDCLAQRLVLPLFEAGKIVRFEFVLPREWISLPVDQLMVGGDDENPPTRIGSSHPVVIRPQNWCRPKAANARAVMFNLFARKRERARRAETAKLRVLACPADWGDDEVRNVRDDDALVGLVLPFDPAGAAAPGKGDPILLECLKTWVLAVLWVRAGAPASVDSAEGRAYLECLLKPLPHAPERVLDARRTRGGPGSKLRDHLSLIWHVDPIDLTDLHLVTPEIAP
ncbi:hypothetical protein [Sorangium sp. So ce385]|uniref:VMAP-C domain-containing protein n=1 Tax=Sorangium sp. So ce385 TaxID=3133308 RepID=UPI003F5BD6E7